jgi:hypothetical protein
VKIFMGISIGLLILALFMFTLTYFFAASDERLDRESSTMQGTTQSIEDSKSGASKNSTSPYSGK